MTTGPSYERVFNRLQAAFPLWEGLTNVPVSTVSEIISDAGLTNQKAPRLIDIAHQLKGDFGVVTLDPIMAYTDHDAEKFLTSLPGVGLKTAKCVMMYSMNRAVLPVDTHVSRVAQRFGLLDDTATASRWHSDLEAVITPKHRYDFHVNAVAHGRAVCRSRFPDCDTCGAKSICPTGQHRMSSRSKRPN